MYKFTTVRKPEDIMVSLYFYVKNIAKNKNNKFNIKEISDVKYILSDKEIYEYKNKTIYTNSFNELDYFESYIENSGIDGFIKKVISKKRQVSIPLLNRVDHSVNLYDINDINNHWKNILKKINIDENTKLEKINQSKKDLSIKIKKETVDLIKDTFEIDYKNIPQITGYKWD